MDCGEEIDKIYYELLRQREEKIKETAKPLSDISVLDIEEAIQISEEARTRYMVKAAAIFLFGRLRK